MKDNKSSKIKKGPENYYLSAVVNNSNKVTKSHSFPLGLGDYVPQNMHHTVLFGGYILLGLVLVTMLFSAMEEKIADCFDKIKQIVGMPERGEEKKEL